MTEQEKQWLREFDEDKITKEAQKDVIKVGLVMALPMILAAIITILYFAIPWVISFVGTICS